MADLLNYRVFRFFSVVALWMLVLMALVAKPVILTAQLVYQLILIVWQRFKSPPVANNPRAQQRPQPSGWSMYKLFEILFLLAARVRRDPEEPQFTWASMGRRLTQALYSAIFFSLAVWFLAIRLLRITGIPERLEAWFQSATGRRVLNYMLRPLMFLLLVPFILMDGVLALKLRCIQSLKMAFGHFSNIIQRQCYHLKEKLVRTIYSYRNGIVTVGLNVLGMTERAIKYSCSVHVIVWNAVKRGLEDMKETFLLTKQSFLDSYRQEIITVFLYVLGMLLLTERAIKYLVNLCSMPVFA